MTAVPNRHDVFPSPVVNTWRHEEQLAFIVRLAGDLQRAMRRLDQQGLHDALFLLQRLSDVPTGYHFVLQLGGPFSSELESNIAKLRAIGWLEVAPSGGGSGVQYRLGPDAAKLLQRYGSASAQYERHMHALGSVLQPMGALERELLASAAFVEAAAPDATSAQHVATLQALHPKIGEQAAQAAVAMLRTLAQRLHHPSAEPARV